MLECVVRIREYTQDGHNTFFREKGNGSFITQTYFAVQTRRAELIEQRILETERLSARKKLTQTEKELSQIIDDQTDGNQNFTLIRSKGDQALFR